MLTILTLTWEGKDHLKRLYDSLLPSLPQYGWRWFIRDNDSKDGTKEMVMSWDDPRVVLYIHPNNLQNYSEGNNYLFDRSASNNDDYILLLNNDIVFKDTTSILKMMQILDMDPAVGVVGAKLNYEDRPHILQHAGVLFHPKNRGTPFHFRAGEIELDRDRQNRYYPMVTGACLLTRAYLYRKIRLNEKLQWCWDDSMYCLSVLATDSRVVYCGETSIAHSESASLKKNPINKLFFDQNIRIFFNECGAQVEKNLYNLYKDNPDYAIYKGR